jgi:hypothetical protein
MTKTRISITADGSSEVELDLTEAELDGVRKLAIACERRRAEIDNAYLPAIEVEVLADEPAAEPEIERLKGEIAGLRRALMICRPQWGKSFNARTCLEALGELPARTGADPT